jgi:hypothetical protein
MSRARAIVESVLLAVVLGPGLASADGAWLDGPVTTWNRPGMAIPQAPPRHSASQPQCFDSAVKPDSPTRQALVDAGWSLFKESNATGVPFEILSGQANADGMCRPTDYQVFVFESGVFAGTLSPGLMDSRTDGALVETQIQSGDVFLASYQRYTPQDPLCCPSARSTATFTVDRSGPSPVVVLQSVTTESTVAVSPTPPSAASATAPARRSDCDASARNDPGELLPGDRLLHHQPAVRQLLRRARRGSNPRLSDLPTVHPRGLRGPVLPARGPADAGRPGRTAQRA